MDKLIKLNGMSNSIKIQVIYFLSATILQGFLYVDFPLLIKRPKYYCNDFRSSLYQYCQCQSQRKIVEQGFYSLTLQYGQSCAFDPQQLILNMRFLGQFLGYLIPIFIKGNTNIFRLITSLFVIGTLLIMTTNLYLASFGIFLIFLNVPVWVISLVGKSQYYFGHLGLLIVSLMYLILPLTGLLASFLSYAINNYRLYVLFSVLTFIPFSTGFKHEVHIANNQQLIQKQMSQNRDKNQSDTFTLLRCCSWYVSCCLIYNIVSIYINTLVSLPTQINLIIINIIDICISLLVIFFAVNSQNPRLFLKRLLLICGFLLLLIVFFPRFFQIIFFIGIKLALGFVWVIQISTVKQMIKQEQQLNNYFVLRGILASLVSLILPITRAWLEKMGYEIYFPLGLVIIWQGLYYV